jgi:hypothetical protein
MNFDKIKKRDGVIHRERDGKRKSLDTSNDSNISCDIVEKSARVKRPSSNFCVDLNDSHEMNESNIVESSTSNFQEYNDFETDSPVQMHKNSRNETTEMNSFTSSSLSTTAYKDDDDDDDDAIILHPDSHGHGYFGMKTTFDSSTETKKKNPFSRVGLLIDGKTTTMMLDGPFTLITLSCDHDLPKDSCMVSIPQCTTDFLRGSTKAFESDESFIFPDEACKVYLNIGTSTFFDYSNYRNKRLYFCTRLLYYLERGIADFQIISYLYYSGSFLRHWRNGVLSSSKRTGNIQ